MITHDPRSPGALLASRLVEPRTALAEALDALRTLAARWRSRGKEPSAMHRLDVLEARMDASGVPGARR